MFEKVKLKQTNKGYSCPNCKNLSLDELPNIKHRYMYETIEFINNNKARKFRCRLCLAEFMEELR